MKQIGIIRTSTIKQEVESQRAELLKYMIADGCSEEDIIIIGQAGASAIKLDEAYMRNMNKVYKLISNGDISCIYAYALDRIGRNEEFLVNFKNTCINNKVQLKIMNPYMFLLNDDGTVNNGMEMMFSLHIIHAKQEMLDKSSRFKRAKARNAAEKKYNGGYMCYGYCVDEKGYIVIKPEEAEIVRLIFSLFSTGKYSTRTLSIELEERGYKINRRKIIGIINNTAYYGKGKNSLDYIPIIEKSLYDKCREIADRNNVVQIKTPRYYLGSKLIRCPVCGNHYVSISNRIYTCSAHFNKYKECNNDVTISSVALDKVLLYIAEVNEVLTMQIDRAKSIENVQNEIQIIEDKIVVLKEKADKETKDKLSRVKEMYIEGDLTKKEYKEKVEKINDSVGSIKMKVVEYENNLVDLKNRLSFLSYPVTPYNPQTATQKDKYDIVHRNIESVSLTRIKKCVLEVIIVCGGIDYTYHYYSHKKNHWYIVEGENEIMANFN